MAQYTSKFTGAEIDRTLEIARGERELETSLKWNGHMTHLSVGRGSNWQSTSLLTTWWQQTGGDYTQIGVPSVDSSAGYIRLFETGDTTICVDTPSYRLHVNGAVGATNYVTTSDIRLKNIIEDNITIDVNKLAKAPLFKFTWKEDKNIDDKNVRIGTSALYWQNIIKELVSVGKDEKGTLSLDYSSLAVASSISLAKKVVEQEKTISDLRKEIEDLKQDIAEIKDAINK